MDRINHSSAEADKFGAGKDGWTNGDPVDPGSGTVPQDAWYDGVQEELVAGLIEQAGLTPSNADYTQLRQALDILYQQTEIVPYYTQEILDSGKQKSVAAETSSTRDVTFANDGGRMYVNSLTTVYEYILNDPFDVSTASYTGRSYDMSPSSSDTLIESIFVRNDGVKLYALGATNDRVYEWTMSTPYVINSASYVNSHSVTAEDTAPLRFDFSQDGVFVFVLGQTNDKIFRYTCSTPWDINSMLFDTGQELLVSGQDSVERGVAVSNDGLKIFMTGATADTMYQYDMSTAYDLTTATYNSVFHNFASWTTSLQSVAFSPSGSRVYVVTDAGPADTVREFYSHRVIAKV